MKGRLRAGEAIALVAAILLFILMFFDWYGAKAGYLYWHPGEQRFRIDVEARTAKTPSAEFREKTPWPPGQGPNAPPAAGGSGR